MNRVIRTVKKKDAIGIWEIRNHPQSRKNSLDQNEIPVEEHLSWFRAKYFGPNSGNFCYVLVIDGRIAGYSRFDSDKGHFRSSIAIHPDFRGQGQGFKLLKCSLAKLPAGSVVDAEIRKDNISSIRIFEKCGFAFNHDDTDNIYLSVTI